MTVMAQTQCDCDLRHFVIKFQTTGYKRRSKVQITSHYRGEQRLLEKGIIDLMMLISFRGILVHASPSFFHCQSVQNFFLLKYDQVNPKMTVSLVKDLVTEQKSSTTKQNIPVSGHSQPQAVS